METTTFKQAVCRHYNIPPSDYVEFVLKRTLFHRVRFIRPVLAFFYPNFLFNEKRLMEKVGRAENLREIQEEVDFYQHKYVVVSPFKDALRFRVSGMRLMSIANMALNNRIKAEPSPDYSGARP